MKILKYILVFLLIVLIIVGVGGVLLYDNITRAPLPQVDGTLTVAGLNAPVEIIRDAYGVPHIYASNSHDLFFAQGFTHAQDRWWQMALFRATGNGRLQELVGQQDSLSGTDIFIRTIGWRRSAERDVNEIYDEQTITYMQAFTDGVNAYLNSRDKNALALEYRLLGLTGVDAGVSPWTLADSAVWQKVMSWDLSNGGFDRTRAEMLETFGESLFNDLEIPFEFDKRPTIVTAQDLPITEQSLVPQSSLPTVPPVVYEGDIIMAGNISPQTNFGFGQGDDLGSNSWVVSGDKTDTGKPLLANDPHLGIQMPSIWYEIGLHCQPVSDECPFNVRGQTLSPFPGVVIGHNDRIAWGFTNVGPDNMDFFRIKVNPENPLQYEYNGEWVDMTVHEEVIRYADSAETLTLQVRETRFGPIINDNQLDENGQPMGFNNENPLAMRWAALDPSHTLTALFTMNAAQNWEEFRAGVALFDAPSQNLVYADVDGNIGYQTPGLIPVRPAANDGLWPVDGSTDEYEWLGYIPYDDLPRVLNPERGYIQTANQAVVPLEYYETLNARLSETYGQPVNAVIGTDWAQGYRGQRIAELLEATEIHSIDTFKTIQGDNKAVYAQEMMPFISAVDYGSDSLNDMRDWLAQWDFMANADSAPAALFNVFYAHLMNELFDDQTDDLITVGTGSAHAVARLMSLPDNAWWDDVRTADTTETRDDILKRAFASAVEDTQARLGTDRSKWQWGTLHQANFISEVMGNSGISIIEGLFNRMGTGVGGGGEIVNATGWNAGDEDYTLRALPSFRMIVDMSNLDNSVNIHTTGQSSHPFSEFYDNMIPLWARVEYKPMLFTREAVQAAAKYTLTLQP